MSDTATLRRVAVRAATVVLALCAAPMVAHAAAIPSGGQPPQTRPLAARSAGACDGGGSFRGSGDNHLSNGTLTTGFCRYPAGGVGTVNIQYHKSHGDVATVQFAWEWVDTRGANPTGRQYDNGSFRISSGQTRTFQWRYGSPGNQSPSGNAPCTRGVLISGSDTFSTRIVC
jgi:hypothetical protein